MANQKRVGKVLFSNYVVAECLKFPKGTKIIDAQCNLFSGEIEFMVENKDLPLVSCDEIPFFHPIYTRQTIEFDWNLENG